MKNFVPILLISFSVGICSASDDLVVVTPAVQKKRRAVFQELRDAISKKQIIALVAQHPFLREPHLEQDDPIPWQLITHSCGYPQEEMHKLFELGVPIDQTADSKRRTTLMISATGNRDDGGLSTLRGLLADKADPTVQDVKGCNAFGYAVGSPYSAHQLNLLATHAALASVINQPMAIDGRMRTCLHALTCCRDRYTIYRKKILKKFLKAGALVQPNDVANIVNICPDLASALKKCSWRTLVAAKPLIEKQDSMLPLETRQATYNMGLRYCLQHKQLKDIFRTSYGDDTPYQEYGAGKPYQLIKGYLGMRYADYRWRNDCSEQ